MACFKIYLISAAAAAEKQLINSKSFIKMKHAIKFKEILFQKKWTNINQILKYTIE